MSDTVGRLGLQVRSRLNEAVNNVEDPDALLDYSYEVQRELLRQVRRCVAIVAESRRWVETRLCALKDSSARLRDQAEQALAAGLEDVTHGVLARRAVIESRLTELRAHEAALRDEEDRLFRASRRLSTTVDTFGVREQALKASCLTGDARSGVAEAIAIISEEMNAIHSALRRVRDTSEQTSACAGSAEDLVAAGVVEDITLDLGRDTIQEFLDAAATQRRVRDDLARLKAEIAASTRRHSSTNPGRASNDPSQTGATS